jgi:hypothetical protein
MKEYASATRRRLIRVTFLIGCGIFPALSECTRESSATGPSLETLPLLEQPNVSVSAIGFHQKGRHLELAAILINGSMRLDACEPTVTLVAMSDQGEIVTQRTRQLSSIPAGATIATSMVLDLDSDVQVARVDAYVGFPDAAISSARTIGTLNARVIAVRIQPSGEVFITGEILPHRAYPVPYRLDLALLDERGKIVRSARSDNLRPQKEQSTAFTAVGLATPGADTSRLRTIVTLTPDND